MTDRVERGFAPDRNEQGRRRFMIAAEHVILRGFERDDAERCYRENTHGPTVLAVASMKHGIQLMSYSTDLMFNGEEASPYVESDRVAPLNVYGKVTVHPAAAGTKDGVMPVPQCACTA